MCHRYFIREVENSLKNARLKMRKLARILHLNDRKNHKGYLLLHRFNKNKAKVIRILDFVIFHYNVELHNIEIHELQKYM